jgi:hypothetical protein
LRALRSTALYSLSTLKGRGTRKSRRSFAVVRIPSQLKLLAHIKHTTHQSVSISKITVRAAVRCLDLSACSSDVTGLYSKGGWTWAQVRQNTMSDDNILSSNVARNVPIHTHTHIFTYSHTLTSEQGKGHEPRHQIRAKCQVRNTISAFISDCFFYLSTDSTDCTHTCAFKFRYFQ